jgi:hypothetical protein
MSEQHIPSPTPLPPSATEIAGNLRQLADQLDGLINTFTSAQTLRDAPSRAFREAAALTNVMEHPAMLAVAAWLDEETARGNEDTRRIGRLLTKVINCAKAISDSDQAATRPSLLVLPPRDTQNELNNLAAFATTVGQLLRRQAEQLSQCMPAPAAPAGPSARTHDKRQDGEALPVPMLSEDYIAALSGKTQRKLLRAVNGKGNVLIENVLLAVYGSKDKAKLDALMRAKDRVNRQLTMDGQGHEVRREGETLVLSAL